MKTPKYEINFNGTTNVSISPSNSKLGNIPNISLLPGSDPLTLKNGTLLTDIQGTCIGCDKDCSDSCYAKSFCKLHHNACVPAYGNNTLLARHELQRYFDGIQHYLDDNIVGVFRYHVAGEIPSYEYLCQMCILAKNNPFTRFYCYTKRFSWIEQYSIENTIPNNMIFLVSIWNGNYSNPLNFPEFIYDDLSDESLKNIPHCPAFDKDGNKTGMTCAKCKQCFSSKNGSKIAVYAH